MSGFAALIARARGGARDALDELLACQLQGLRAYVRQHSGHELRSVESQSDLVQSVCREVLGGLAEARCADEPSFRQWLYSVARHKILGKVDYHRAQKRDIRRLVGGDTSLLAAYGTSCSPSQEASQREQVEAVKAAFDQLADDYRRVLLEVCVLGRSHRDVAVEMGRSEEALRQLLVRARARLAMLLQRAP